MNVIIVGAGTIGRHIASVLSGGESNVTIIDRDAKKLEIASQREDVATILGSGTDWQLLEGLTEQSPDFFIALTRDDETNLVACSMAKNLGYPKTVARIRGKSYLNSLHLNFNRIFHVDHFLNPSQLVAYDIFKYIMSLSSVAVENFAHGSVQMRTLIVPGNWRKSHIPIMDLSLPNNLIVSLISRPNQLKSKSNITDKRQIIFPHGNDFLLPGDEITFIGEANAIFNLHQIFNINQRFVKTVAIVGGSLTASFLAKILVSKGILVKIIEKDYQRCCVLSEELPNCTIIHQDALDINFLQAEKVSQCDVIVSCAREDEVNVLAGVLSKKAGCEHAIVSMSNTSNAVILKDFGIAYTLSPRLSASFRILSIIRAASVASMVSLYDGQAEILEVKIPLDSKITGIPLKELAPLFPKDFLVAAIQNRGRIFIANGQSVFCPGDTAIVISHPDHQKEMQRVF